MHLVTFTIQSVSFHSKWDNGKFYIKSHHYMYNMKKIYQISKFNDKNTIRQCKYIFLRFKLYAHTYVRI